MKDNVFTIFRLVDEFSDKFRNMYDDYDEFMKKKYEICLDMEVFRREITHPFLRDFSDKDFVSEINELYDHFSISFRNITSPSSKIYSEFCVMSQCLGALYGEVDYKNRLIDDFDEFTTDDMKQRLNEIQRFIDEFEFHFKYVRSKCDMVIEAINVINLNIGELVKVIYEYYKNCLINVDNNVDNIAANGCLKRMLRLVDKHSNQFKDMLNDYNKIIAKMDVINLDIGVLKTKLEDKVEDNLHSPTILDKNGKCIIII